MQHRDFESIMEPGLIFLFVIKLQYYVVNAELERRSIAVDGFNLHPVDPLTPTWEILPRFNRERRLVPGHAPSNAERIRCLRLLAVDLPGRDEDRRKFFRGSERFSREADEVEVLGRVDCGESGGVGFEDRGSPEGEGDVVDGVGFRGCAVHVFGCEKA